MTKIKIYPKRMLAWVLAFAMVFTLLPVMSVPAQAATALTDGGMLTFNGSTFTAESDNNLDDLRSNGNAEPDGETTTWNIIGGKLYLNNFEYSASLSGASNGALKIPENIFVEIVLMGNNSISAMHNSEVAGIYVDTKSVLTFSGNGKLEVSGTGSGGDASGIRAASSGKLVFDGKCQITATGNNSTVAYGIYTEQIEINGARVKAIAGNASSFSIGLYMPSPGTGGTMILSTTDGKLDAQGGDANNSYGIYISGTSSMTFNPSVGGALEALAGTATTVAAAIFVYANTAITTHTVTGGDDTSADATLYFGDKYYRKESTSGEYAKYAKIAVLDEVVSTAEISGVTAPVAGATPITAITDSGEYTGTVTWSPVGITFDYDKVYTATITLTAEDGYTLTGVVQNFFIVAGATATNDANSGVITAVFPATEEEIVTPNYALVLDNSTGKLLSGRGGSDITAEMAAKGATVTGSTGAWILSLDSFKFETSNDTGLEVPDNTTIYLTGASEITAAGYGVNINPANPDNSSMFRVNFDGMGSIKAEADGWGVGGTVVTIGGTATVEAIGGGTAFYTAYTVPNGYSYEISTNADGTGATTGTSDGTVVVAYSTHKYAKITAASGGISGNEPTALLSIINGVSGLEAEWDDATDTVTVTGSATVSDGLVLVIPAGVTVDWRADITSSDHSAICIDGDGSGGTSGADSKFVVSGGSITTNNNLTESVGIYTTSDNIEIVVEGGTISGGSTTHADGDTYGIWNEGNGNITVNGGTINGGSGSSDGNGKSYGIYNEKAGDVTMTGGMINGGSGKYSYGIHNYSYATGDIAVSGDAEINGGNGSERSYGIYSDNAGKVDVSGNVKINGGSGNTSCGVYSDDGDITILGNAQINGGSGSSTSIGINGDSGDITISGNAYIKSEESSLASIGVVVGNGDVTMSDGTVLGGKATYDPQHAMTGGIYSLGGDITVSGGKVINYDGPAIACNTDNSGVAISGSAAIFGKDVKSAIVKETQPTPGGNAVIITWTGSTTTYDKNTATDLTATPVGATAKWNVVGGKNGVTYTNDLNTGFIEVAGVTVNSGSTAPAITTTSLPNGTVGTVYTQTLASTGTTPITWSYSGSLPTGLTLNQSTGVISGTPTLVETNTFTVTATNSAGSDTKSLSITINSVTEKPTPTTSDLNYTLTDTTYNKTPQSVTITPKTGVGAVTVKYNGSITKPTNAGTYTITADIAEGTNYSAATGIVIGAWTITKRPITITADTKTKSIGTAEPTLTYNITSGSLLSGDTLTGGLTRRTGETVGVYAIISTLTNPNYAITYVGSNLTITSPAVPTPQIPTGGISGTVTDNSGSRDITVRIELGNKIAAGIIIDNAANPKTFSFTELIDGYYNIVVDNGIYKTTRIVEVKDGQSTSGIEMELGQKQSVVEVKPADSGSSTATPDVVVGGLDELFPADDTTNETFTQEDKDVVAAGGTVEIKLIAIGKSEGNVTADANKIKKIASGKTLSFMDFTVEKTQLNQDGDKIKNDTIPVLSDIITIVFPIPSYAKNTNGIKPGFAIYRVHEGSEEIIPKGEANKNSDGEYFEIINDNIILKVKKFSTYAIGYTDDTTGGNQGGNSGGSTITTNAQNPTISVQPKDAAIKVDETNTLIVESTVSDGGTVSYQWYVNTSAKNSGGTAIVGATKESYIVSTTKAGTYYYYVVVTNTNNSVNGSKTATTASNAVTITVTEKDTETKQFTVTYKKNGGGTVSGILSDKAKYDNGSKVTVIGIPVSTSKFFSGWNTKADGTGKSYTAGKTFKITSDVTLYAQWKNTVTDNKKLKYKVTGKNKVTCIGTIDKDATNIAIGETVKYKGITYKITSIAKNAFKGNDKITTVKIGNNVKIIDKKAFFKCTNLEKVTIGTGLITLNDHVFCHGKDGIVIIINSTKLKTVKTSTNHGTKRMVIKVPKNKLSAYKKLFTEKFKDATVEAK